MKQARRYHPLHMLFGVIQLLRNAAFIALFLFVMKADSQFLLIVWGRNLFLPFLALAGISIFLKWLSNKYTVDDAEIHLSKGVFVRSKQTVPFSKVQNTHRHTSILHRLFGVTSLTLETGMEGIDSAVEFKVISLKGAAWLEEKVSAETEAEMPDMSGRTLHFTPEKKDLIKAAYTSLSFLVLLSLIASIYTKASEFIDLEERGLDFLKVHFSSWQVQASALIFFLLLSVLAGFLRTYIKYGKYEILSDEKRIYIRKGFLEETSFSISKDRVQAIEIKQNAMKRLAGVAEVKLAAAGDVMEGEEKEGVNSLFPFLPVDRAYKLAEEILPAYEVSQSMVPLPKKALWASLLSPSWLWIISTAALFYFKPEFLRFGETWIAASVLLFILVVFAKAAGYANARYLINGPFIQFKTGIIGTRVFISKRSKIIEAEVTATRWQKMFGLASIQTVNRGKPVQHAGVENVPAEWASSFHTWYKGRTNEVKIK
ncbi:PH domain-containing protein [Cytobacillus firmus]|uniref:PH domain-containing protein n=1 Tax=Cytobacillus firmus TaxID=1399 RepID=UPI0024C1715B|nr:PH domain-containing protein [Cytobacillus firmus]WHY62313.1 PH domain-containing protein [Cytobacillus firmus]